MKFPSSLPYLCDIWCEKIQDAHWHPFKIILVDGQLKEVIDKDDELLKGLKNESGEVAYFAYNTSGRFRVKELWNFKENRRATVMEGVAALAHSLRKHHPTI
ncbi:hypothetical protein MKX01_029140 [Papaver californicum]|nr:hypothetical protein MKX01_029140 [Papaver californicum]